MTDRMKKVLFWVGIFPIIIAAWGSISATVYNMDVIIRMVEIAGNKDENGINGLDRFLIQEIQHQTLWDTHVNRIIME